MMQPNWCDAFDGVAATTAIALSSAAFGVLYGATCVSLGISTTLAVVSSAIVFSGAVQFAALSLLSGPAPLFAIAVSSLLIAFRMVLLGASIASHFKGRTLAMSLVSMPVLSDGNWAATVASRRSGDKFVFFVGGGLWIVTLWCAGTFVGAFFAEFVALDLIASLRFAGVLFLVLLLLLVERATRIGHLPWLVSAISSIAISTTAPLPVAFLTGTVIGAVVAWRKSGESTK